jgi:N-acetylmuramoyl-L-alanine amidase
MCPQSTIRGGMIPLLEEFAAIEYLIQSQFADAQFTFESHNPDLVDHTGRVIQRPDRGQTVSYTITIDFEGEVIERTFYTYLPGTVK